MRIIALFLLLGTVGAQAQKKLLKEIDNGIRTTVVESHIRFLSADEMRGRDTGSPELDIAANYIATQFMAFGVLPANGTSYFQPVSLVRQAPPSNVSFSATVNEVTDTLGALAVAGGGGVIDRPLTYVGYGTREEFDNADVNGKIAVCLFGVQGSANLADALFNAGPAKRQMATERGAVALVEVLAIPGVPWGAFVNHFSKSRMMVAEREPGITHLLVQPGEQGLLQALTEKRTGNGRITVEKPLPQPVAAKNVMGIIPGSDATLREQYIAISAHYDHVGVSHRGGGDSIFNGARDNAIGVGGILEAARFFSKHPPKRSLLLIGFTAEEAGLLGSTWYAEHPVVPLKQTVFNFNCDGAGYNDTSIATVMDFNRTSVDDLLVQACTAAGLGLKGDPAPEQGLYDRSDNVNFAKKGVPAVTFSPGVKAFDADLMKYYHQPADEVESLDMNYLVKFYRATLRAVFLLANTATTPAWKPGDKYEPAGKMLYGK